MSSLHNPENRNNSHAAHPSLGKALTAEQAMRRFELRGHWASERKGRIRVVEFKDDGNGSASVTRWFENWHDALKAFGITTTTNDVCPLCGKTHEEALNKSVNRAGNWVCIACEENMNETVNDMFFLSQGRWKA